MAKWNEQTSKEKRPSIVSSAWGNNLVEKALWLRAIKIVAIIALHVRCHLSTVPQEY